jgi:hypothetical protein
MFLIGIKNIRSCWHVCLSAPPIAICVGLSRYNYNYKRCSCSWLLTPKQKHLCSRDKPQLYSVDTPLALSSQEIALLYQSLVELQPFVLFNSTVTIFPRSHSQCITRGVILHNPLQLLLLTLFLIVDMIGINAMLMLRCSCWLGEKIINSPTQFWVGKNCAKQVGQVDSALPSFRALPRLRDLARFLGRSGSPDSKSRLVASLSYYLSPSIMWGVYAWKPGCPAVNLGYCITSFKVNGARLDLYYIHSVFGTISENLTQRSKVMKLWSEALLNTHIARCKHVRTMLDTT